MMMVKILLTLVLIATISITPAFAESIPIKITKMNTLLHHNIPYTGDGVEIQNVTADLDFISLIFGVTVESPGKISITLDRSIFDAVIDGEDDEFFVLADGEEIQFDEEKTDMSRTLSFSVPEGTEEIEVIGTKLFGESFLEKLEESAQKAEEELAANKHYYLHTIDCFGPERCMFESNFPVDKVSCSYGVLWNSFKRIVGHLTRKQKAQLFHGTAARVYRLNTAVS